MTYLLFHRKVLKEEARLNSGGSRHNLIKMKHATTKDKQNNKINT